MTGHGVTGLRLPETVYVSHHVMDQLRQRDRHFARCDNATLIKMISREIAEAFRDGRVARRQPRFTLTHHDALDADSQRSTRGRRSKGLFGQRYVWEAGRQRCYVTRPYRKADRRRGIAVITVYGSQM